MHAPFMLLYLWWSMLMAPFQTVRIPGPGGTPTSTPSNTFTLVQQQNVDNATCTSAPTCVFTVTSTGTGHLLVITATQFSGAANYISSVSGGGTWVVPTGANYQMANACCGAVSSAYVLSSTSGTTSITVTWNGTFAALLDFREFSFTGGSTSLDTGATLYDSVAGTSQPGPALTLSGSSDAIMQSSVCESGPNAIDGSYIGTYFAGFSGYAYKINTGSGTAPNWTLPASGRCTTSAIAFK